MRAAEGGPFDREREVDEVIQQAILAQYHLDKPVYEQFMYFLGDLAQGDLGPSFSFPGQGVSEVIGEFLLPPCTWVYCRSFSRSSLA